MERESKNNEINRRALCQRRALKTANHRPSTLVRPRCSPTPGSGVAIGGRCTRVSSHGARAARVARERAVKKKAESGRGSGAILVCDSATNKGTVQHTSGAVFLRDGHYLSFKSARSELESSGVLSF